MPGCASLTGVILEQSNSYTLALDVRRAVFVSSQTQLISTLNISTGISGKTDEKRQKHKLQSTDSGIMT